MRGRVKMVADLGLLRWPALRPGGTTGGDDERRRAGGYLPGCLRTQLGVVVADQLSAQARAQAVDGAGGLEGVASSSLIAGHLPGWVIETLAGASMCRLSSRDAQD